MKKESIRMFRDLLLVRRLKFEEEKVYRGASLLIEAPEETRYCDVLAVGKGVHGVKPGDRIILMGETPGGQDFEFGSVGVENSTAALR